MAHRRPRNHSIVIIVPTSAGRHQAAYVEEASEIVTACPLLHDRPVTWSFSAVGVAEDDPRRRERIQRRFQLRQQQAGDEIAPIGYAGAPNVYLGLRELQLELDWAVLNPWDTGLDTLFGGEKRIYIPAAADMRRVDAKRIYGERADIWVSGYLPRTARSGSRLICYERGQAYALPLIFLTPEWRAEIVARRKDPGSELLKQLRRQLRRQSYAVSMLVIETDEQLEMLRSFLTLMDSDSPRRRPGELVPLQTALEYRVAETGPQCRIGMPPDDPEWLTRVLAAAERRAAAAEEEEYSRTVLRLLGGYGPVPSSWAHRQTVRDTALSVGASMLGHAAISEGKCTAELENGRLSAFSYRGENLLAPGAIELKLSIDGRLYELEPESAVSFEIGNARGLRAILSLRHPSIGADPLRAWIDYFFVEASPHLVLELGFDWPRLTGSGSLPLRGSRLLTMPIARLGTDDALGIAAYYPDGSGYRLTLHGGDELGTDSVCGWSFLFRHGGKNLGITFLDPVSKPTLCCPLAVSADSRETDVLLTLGPSYDALDPHLLSSTRERRTILLSPSPIDSAGIEQLSRTLGQLLTRWGTLPHSEL